MMAKWNSLVWHAPGRIWAAMIAAASVSLWLTAGAAMAWTAMSAAFVVLFRGILTSDDAFWIIISAQGITALAIGAMAGQEISFNVTRQGVNFNVGADEAHQKVEVQTKTTVIASEVAEPPPLVQAQWPR